jgi:hypothetical protein
MLHDDAPSQRGTSIVGRAGDRVDVAPDNASHPSLSRRTNLPPAGARIVRQNSAAGATLSPLTSTAGVPVLNDRIKCAQRRTD